MNYNSLENNKKSTSIFIIVLYLIITYILFYLLGGFLGAVILKIPDYYSLSRLSVSIGIILLLTKKLNLHLFNNQNTSIGLFSIAITVLLTLLMNNNLANISRNLPNIGSIVFESISTGMFEETVFRGTIIFLISYFIKTSTNTNFYLVYISSLIFGLAHLLNIYSLNQSLTQTGIQIIYAFCLGTLFSWTYLITNNLLYSTIAHSISATISALFSSTHLKTNVNLTYSTLLLMTIFIVITVLLNIYFIKHFKTIN